MPDLSILQIIEILLILIVVVYLIRFIWIMFIERQYQPTSWRLLAKQKAIAPALIKYSRAFPDKTRFYNIWMQLERIKKSGIPGAYAELGVYKGETARIIHLCDPSRKLHLFDSFQGFNPKDLEVEEGEAATYTGRNFADTSLEKVSRTISGNDNIVFHPGHFPESAEGIQEVEYAFVHIDADLYNPIKAGLTYFYPRLSSGGLIIIHDYNEKWKGAMKAVDEFLKSIPEELIPVPDTDNSVMILKA